MSLSSIAKMAGVSKATVSRVLNNSKNVSPETASKVNAAVKKVGYHPKLRKKNYKSKNIGVLIIGRDLFMEYTPARWRMLYGIQEALSSKGINTVVQKIDVEQSLPANINSNTVDGLILLGKTAKKELLEQAKNIPSVWVNSQGSNDKDHALLRNQLVGQMAAEYLIEKGHTNLAFFKVFTKHQAIEIDGDFFTYTAKKFGCEVTTFEGIESFPEDDSLESWLNLHTVVEKVIRKIISLKPRPTGLFIPVGQIVVISYEKLRKFGIEPGKDIEIIGCGCENAMLASLSPRPANISINTKVIGIKAAEQLLSKISNPKEKAAVNITVIPTLEKGEM